MQHIPFLIEDDKTIKVHQSMKSQMKTFKLLAYLPTGTPLRSEYFKGMWALDGNEFKDLPEEDQAKLEAGEPYALFKENAIKNPDGSLLNFIEIYSRLEDAEKFGLIIKFSRSKKLA